MMITNKVDTKRILAYFDELFPNAGCELIYQKDYELLIAVMLSAQTTDVSVNNVTEKLFKQYPSLETLHNAPIEAIEATIKTIGLYKTKAKYLKEIVAHLLFRFHGVVPIDKAQLTSLPGVGNKTANVVRAEWFHLPEIAVDTHVSRIAKRLGFARTTDDVITIEKKLRKTLEVERYIKTHHQMIHFGRYFCKAKKPQCGHCRLVDICKEKHKHFI